MHSTDPFCSHKHINHDDDENMASSLNITVVSNIHICNAMLHIWQLITW